MALEQRDWSDIPSELLLAISSLLVCELDVMRFRSVCSSWRSAVPSRPGMPWLVGQRKNSPRKHSTYSFFSFHGTEIRPTSLAEARLAKACGGSSHGWMALLGEDFQLTIYNPITGCQIRLPKFSEFHTVFGIEKETICGVVNYYCVANRHLKERMSCVVWDLIFKVVLSSDPVTDPTCTAVLVAPGGSQFVFYRFESKEWSLHPMPVDYESNSNNVDALYHKGQLFVAVGYELFCYHFYPHPELDGSFNCCSVVEHFSHVQTFLVDSCGDLLLVFHCYHWIDYSNIKVYKVEFGTCELVKIDSLGHRSIFVGQNHSFSVSASKFPGIKGNCIYLTDYGDHGFIREKKIRVFNLATGGKEIIPYGSSDPHWEPCAWIIPSLEE